MFKNLLILVSAICTVSCGGNVKEGAKREHSGTIIQEERKNQNPIDESNWEKTEITQLPFRYNYPLHAENIDLFECIDKNKKHPLNDLFSDSTLLQDRFYRYGHPCKAEAVCYKRLPDLYGFRILLFTYHDKSEYKLPSIELQIFDDNDKIIDKMIVAEATDYECAWRRSFEYTKDGLIKITDSDRCVDVTEDTVARKELNVFYYKIHATGRIIRYFPQKNGEHLFMLHDYGDADRSEENIIAEKGRFKNHAKTGLWEEYVDDTFNNTPSPQKYLKAIGYYTDGEKNGEWLYFSSDDQNYDYPLVAQKYKNGTLIEQTDDFEKIERYYPLLKLLQVK